MSNEKILASVVSTAVDTASKNVALATGVSLDFITERVTAEVGKIEAQLSVLVSHIEGRYESEVANLKLEVARLTPTKGFFRRIFS